MNEMLFINNEMMDLSEDINITLNYKNNIFTDLSKIVGNNSYTIQLPKTVKNLRIIGNADAPASGSDFPRTSHPCRYFRNGVEIIPNGRAVLMSVGDSIEVVITWGSTTGFASLVEDGKNLNELARRDDYIVWKQNLTPDLYGFSTEIKDVVLADIDFGLKTGELHASMHPSARLGYIFDLIQEVYGVRFEFPDDKKEFIDSLLFPLLTRNGGYANSLTNEKNVYYTMGWLEQSGGSDSGKVFQYSYSNGYIGSIRIMEAGTVKITPNFKSGVQISFSVRYGDNTLSNAMYLPYRIESGLYIYDQSIELELSEGDYFALPVLLGYASGLDVEYPTFTFGMVTDEIQLNDKFPIVENLPKVKTTDFIKAVASMVGVFAIPSEDGSVIRFISIDRLSHEYAFDWSERLLPHTDENKPMNISYTLDDFARNNLFKYKDDESVAINADGSISVGDSTLEYERDSVTLPFAASDSRGMRAFIPVYKYNDEGMPELQDVEPRILREIDVNGYSTGTFKGLSWGELLAEYYGTYQRMVGMPVIITEKMIMDDIQLRDLDMTRSIYLKQYGRYYAIIEIKAPSDGVCECRLLQINV